MSSTTDRELLGLAAKAMGLRVISFAGDRGLWVLDTDEEWNPLADDGDALRLACDAGLNVFPIARTSTGRACSAVGTHGQGRLSEVAYASLDVRAATRRAIVCAAAEVGRKMP